jgi:hypothetical protein
MNNLQSTTPGEYVRGPITATVESAYPKTTNAGKTIFKCILRDGQLVAEATSFSRTFEHVVGKRVQITGMGLRRGNDYGGKMGLVVGDKATVKAIGDAPLTQTTPVAEEPRKSEGKAVSGPSKVEGVTVGMAINKAVDALIASQADVNAENVWHRASMLIRVAQRLQSGELAPVTATNEVPSDEAPF